MTSTSTRTVSRSTGAQRTAESSRGDTTVVLVEVAGQELGLPARQVEQVRTATQVTHLPGAPTLIEGVVNLHGEVVPVLDGRRRLGITHRDVRPADRFVILSARGKKLAMHVDGAAGVVEVPAADIESAAALRMDTFRCAGIARLKGGLFIVHDTDGLLAPREFAVLDQALATFRRRAVDAHE